MLAGANLIFQVRMKPKGPKPGAQRADGGGGILGDGEAILPTRLRVWESGVRADPGR